MLAGAESLPLPSPGDALYLLFHPLMLAALVAAVRRRLRGPTSSVWLDSVVGSLGAAAVLAALLSPVLDSALTGSLSLATVVERTLTSESRSSASLGWRHRRKQAGCMHPHMLRVTDACGTKAAKAAACKPAIT